MSKAAETARQWLADLVKSANLTAEAKTALETTLAAPEALDFIGRSALRQADYDRLMNQTKTQLSSKMQEIQGYEQSLATWRGQTEAQVAQVQAELNKARAEAQRIRQVAYSYNLTDEDLGAPVAPATTPPGVDPTQSGTKMTDTPKPFSIDDVLTNEKFQELSQMFTLLPAEVADITAEHVRLFGAQPDKMREITNKALAERRPLRDVWEETYEVSDKREDLKKVAFEAEVARRVEEEKVKFRTELLTGQPTARPGIGQGSYVLSNRDKLTPSVDPQIANNANTRAEGVNAAVQYWNSLKHEE
jgi:hypothetical protein